MPVNVPSDCLLQVKTTGFTFEKAIATTKTFSH